MTNSEYFIYAVKSGYLKKLNWYFSTCAYQPDDNEYLKKSANSYLVYVNDEWVTIDNVKTDRPLFLIHDIMDLDPINFPNLKSNLKTYFGRALVNYLLLIVPFKDKIEFINKETSVSAIEKIISSRLVADKDAKEGDLTVSEYLLFVDAVTMLQSLSRLFTLVATPKNILKPPGIDNFKIKVKEHLTKKYGEGWENDYIHATEYKTLLSKYDEEWLKDDPTNNRMISGKFKNNGRSRTFLAFGADVGFGNSEDANLIEESLIDGYPKDNKKLASAFNSSRAASFNRGKETQKGGAVAKDILRATNSLIIEKGDCGSRIYKPILVTKDIAKSLINRWMNNNGKEVLITKPEELIGKTIEVRSPLYCKYKNKKVCARCVGEGMGSYKHGTMLLATDISSSMLKASLKKMHKSNISTTTFDILKVIS